MIFQLSQEGHYDPNFPISLRCPACRQKGTFVGHPNVTDMFALREASYRIRLGQRICPNRQCRSHIFFVWDEDAEELLISYPPERIDFDSTNIPQQVLVALEEAITCHANSSFIAAGIMVRKTLEELCHERSAQGGNLKDRITMLGTKVIMPQELLDGLDNLRLLGNDAAHIESQTYNQVGSEEIELAIEVTKEVLKAVYQYSALVDKLKALKK